MFFWRAYLIHYSYVGIYNYLCFLVNLYLLFLSEICFYSFYFWWKSVFIAYFRIIFVENLFEFWIKCQSICDLNSGKLYLYWFRYYCDMAGRTILYYVCVVFRWFLYLYCYFLLNPLIATLWLLRISALLYLALLLSNISLLLEIVNNLYCTDLCKLSSIILRRFDLLSTYLLLYESLVYGLYILLVRSNVTSWKLWRWY